MAPVQQPLVSPVCSPSLSEAGFIELVQWMMALLYLGAQLKPMHGEFIYQVKVTGETALQAVEVEVINMKFNKLTHFKT